MDKMLICQESGLEFMMLGSEQCSMNMAAGSSTILPAAPQNVNYYDFSTGLKMLTGSAF